ncbi:hypothetical protein IAT38_002255 [Cryptococcus sp. DSM 104549]
MGDNIVNFYAGQPPLNRVAFQRHHASIVNEHLHKDETRFIIFKDFKPLVIKGQWGTPLYLGVKDVEGIIGNGYDEAPSDVSKETAKLHETALLPSTRPTLVFLGIDDRADPTTNASSATDHLAPRGPAFFALDVTSVPAGEFDVAKLGGAWGDARASGGAMSPWDAGVYAQARALVDWNGRNKFCAACGSPTYSLWAGWKRSCTSALEPVPEGKEPCFSTKGLHNFAYPRTDPVIIMGILNSTGDKMLLGRNKAWPKGMYSCLAGFIEPGESFEDAVRREVLEEAGIEVGPVRYASSQPWPFPANLMIGCFGRATDGQTIRLDLDNELEDARWFPRSIVNDVIASKSKITLDDYKKLRPKTDAETATAAALAPSERKPEEVAANAAEVEGKAVGGGRLSDAEVLTKVPDATAIAGMLMRTWAAGELELVSKL